MTNGEFFLQYDNNNNNRILIFGTAANLDFLQNSPHWFMDGTFRTVPPQFMQLYTVHGLQRGHNVVGAYALLRNKEANTYTEMLTQIRALTNNVEPESFMTDFETGSSTALGRVYPNVPKKGCFFHLCKNVFKHVQAEGLLDRYLNDENFRINVKMISAIAFVPTDDVIDAFQELSDHCGDDEQAILDYFETYYIGEQRRGRRLRARFPHAMWNVHGRVENDLPRTNNHLEGWHNRFNAFISVRHADIWKFIQALKGDCALQNHTRTQAMIGADPPRQRLVYRQVNERLQNLVENYNVNDKINYLRGIAYNLAF